MVVMRLPTAADAGSWHAFVACPSTWTVQAPQRAMPHPYLVPVSPILSRKTQSSGVSGSTSTVSRLPLMFNVSCMNAFLSSRAAFVQALEGAFVSHQWCDTEAQVMLVLRVLSIKGPGRGSSSGRPVQRMSPGGRLRIRTVLWTPVGLVLVRALGFAVLGYEPEIAPITRPDPASFDKALVERGRVLANYGDCTACHTRPDGPPFAGNLPIKTPFGTIYTSNVTPDADTGIGTW